MTKALNTTFASISLAAALVAFPAVSAPSYEVHASASEAMSTTYKVTASGGVL